MRKLLTASAAALALAGVTIGAAAPAEARYYGRGYYGHYHHGGRTAAVLGAGILGLAAGAAIADSGPRYYRPYAPAYYGPPPAYYAPPPVYYDYAPVCRTDWRWDGYVGRYVRVRYCD